MAFARHASNSVGHFISVISNVTTLVKYTRSRTFYIKYGYILIPLKDLEDLDGAVVDKKEPVKHSDVLVEDPEEIKKHAKKLEKFFVKVLKQRLKQKKTPVPEEVKSLESLCELEKQTKLLIILVKKLER